MALLGNNGGLVGVQRVTRTGSGIGVWTANEQAVLRRAGIWPTTGDPYFSSVSLLLHMDGADNSTTFVDNSANAVTVTATGSAKVKTSIVKYGSGALSLDGSNSYLRVPSSTAFDMSTGDWTVECWIYCIDQTNVYPAVLANNGTWGADAVKLCWDELNTQQRFNLNFNTYTGGANNCISTNTFSFNQWRHIACVRSGNSILLFVDGIANGTFTVASTATFNWSAGGYFFVGYSWDASSALINQFIDEVRITKGIARYTTSFTPPAAAFTYY